MNILAIVFGFISSYYLAIVDSRLLLIVIYSARFRFIQPFLVVYDALETKYTYELLGGRDRFQSYSEFSSIYQAKRAGAAKGFKDLWNVYLKRLARDYGLLLLASLLLFWNEWGLFAGPFICLQFFAFLYHRFYRDQDPAFIACTLISILLQGKPVVKTTDNFIKRSE